MTTETTEADNLVLYMFPGACSRVTMSALEQAGLGYEDRMVNIRSGQQKSPDYLSVNPKGKVPTLCVGQHVMTENAAILSFLDRRHPDAKLLPHSADPVADMQGLIDLVWCSGTLHPMVRQIRNPSRYTGGDTAGVYADGLAKLTHEAHGVAHRLADQPWWYGGTWSIVDAYFFWIFTTAEKGGFPLQDFPRLVDHAGRVRERANVQRALAREQKAAERHRADLPLDFQA